MWKHLIHPNILPLLGITIDPLQLISNWMPGGDLPDYIKKNPSADQLGLVGVPPIVLSHTYPRCQLSDIAKGLCYLHSCNVIHGDLKGVRGCSEFCFTAVLTPSQPNILVDNSGHGRIADFGLATVTRNMDSFQSASCPNAHTERWAVPEVLNEGPHSQQADIFSFAMVMIEACHK